MGAPVVVLLNASVVDTRVRHPLLYKLRMLTCPSRIMLTAPLMPHSRRRSVQADSKKITDQLSRTNDLNKQTNGQSPCLDNDCDADPQDLHQFLKKWDIDSQKEIDLVKLIKRQPCHVLRKMFNNFTEDRREYFRNKNFVEVLRSFINTMQKRWDTFFSRK